MCFPINSLYDFLITKSFEEYHKPVSENVSLLFQLEVIHNEESYRLQIIKNSNKIMRRSKNKIPESFITKHSSKKLFWKYAANLQKNAHAEL